MAKKYSYDELPEKIRGLVLDHARNNVSWDDFHFYWDDTMDEIRRKHNLPERFETREERTPTGTRKVRHIVWDFDTNSYGTPKNLTFTYHSDAMNFVLDLPAVRKMGQTIERMIKNEIIDISRAAEVDYFPVNLMEQYNVNDNDLFAHDDMLMPLSWDEALLDESDEIDHYWLKLKDKLVAAADDGVNDVLADIKRETEKLEEWLSSDEKLEDDIRNNMEFESEDGITFTDDNGREYAEE